MDNKSKDSLIFINFNNHVKPRIIENKNKNIVFNGKNNSYFNYVNDRYIGSPTNSAINNGYCRLIYGKGLSAKNESKKPLDWVKLQMILNPIDVQNIIKDFQIQGMAYIQVIKSKGNTLNSMQHISVEKIAPSYADENNDIKGYWYSNDWKRQNLPENTPVYIPAFGTSNEGRELYCIKPYQMGREYFALPSYQSGLQYAELEEEISNFLISHMKNGMSAGYVVNIPNGQNFTVEEKQEIERQIKQQLTGSNNAGNFILNFAFGEEKITVEVLEISDAHDKWQFSSNEAQNKILVSHEVVSPLLFGIKDASGFSSNADELDMAESQTIKRIIQPKQNEILRVIQDILLYYNINLDLYFKPLTEISEADVSSSFTGIQISSAIDIITKVKTNELTVEQASSILRSMLSYPQEEIDNLFNQTQLSKHKIELESYTDYPQGATNNAKRALEWAEKNGWGSCGTPVGKTRANQLAKREPISLDTVKRMAQFKRHQQHKDVPYSEGCGGLMWDAWGGDSGVRWAQTKLKELGLSIDLKSDKDPEPERADYLISLGEDIPEDWIELENRTVNSHSLTEDKLNNIFQLARLPKDSPKAKSKQDTSLFKIRYQYKGNQNPQREFCKKLIKANKVYTKEALDKASSQPVNKGFGVNGSDTYDIFLYKGGVNCKHFWERKIFLKSNNEQISVNQARKMILELDPEDRKEAMWEQNPKEVAQIASPSNNFWKVN